METYSLKKPVYYSEINEMTDYDIRTFKVCFDTEILNILSILNLNEINEMLIKNGYISPKETTGPTDFWYFHGNCGKLACSNSLSFHVKFGKY